MFLVFTFLRSNAQSLVFAEMIENSLVVLANFIVRMPKEKVVDEFMAEIHKMKDVQIHEHQHLREFKIKENCN